MSLRVIVTLHSTLNLNVRFRHYRNSTGTYDRFYYRILRPSGAVLAQAARVSPPLLIHHARQAICTPDDCDGPPDLFVHGMQPIVVTRSRGVDRCGGCGSVVCVPGDVAVHEDTAGHGVEKRVYPTARCEERAGDAEELIREFDSRHGHHAADGYRKLQSGVRARHKVDLQTAGRKTYGQNNVSRGVHDHESGSSGKFRGIVVDDAAETTLEMEEDVRVYGYRAKFDNKYPEIMEEKPVGLKIRRHPALFIGQSLFSAVVA